MDDETHRYIDKIVETVNAQNDTRFTKASSEVKDVQAEMSVTKTELGAKVDGVETQVGSLRTELTAKVDSSKTELTAKVDSSKTELTAKIDTLDTKVKSGFERLTDRLNAQNPLTSWQIFGMVLAAIFSAVAIVVGIIYGYLSVSGYTLAPPDNRAEIAEIVAEALAQSNANSSQNATPIIAPVIQEPDEGGSDSSPSHERN